MFTRADHKAINFTLKCSSVLMVWISIKMYFAECDKNKSDSFIAEYICTIVVHLLQFAAECFNSKKINRASNFLNLYRLIILLDDMWEGTSNLPLLFNCGEVMSLGSTLFLKNIGLFENRNKEIPDINTSENTAVNQTQMPTLIKVMKK